MEEKIVKVRGRQGTKSLDLTIPAEINTKYDIKKGDLFKISIFNEKGALELKYERIYKTK